MITLIDGLPRVGKTSLVTALAIISAQDLERRRKRNFAVLNLRRRGYTVAESDYALYAEFNIKHEDPCGRQINSILIEPERLGRDIYIRPYSTIAISEMQAYFSARAWQRFTLEQQIFFQTSGHFGLDIIGDAQHVDHIEERIRSIAQVIHVEKRTSYNSEGKPTDHVSRFDCSKIVWDVVRFENFKAYERGKGKRDKIQIDFCVFECYNNEERFDNYLPVDKNILIK